MHVFLILNSSSLHEVKVVDVHINSFFPVIEKALASDCLLTVVHSLYLHENKCRILKNLILAASVE